jgi:hypothetical protein
VSAIIVVADFSLKSTAGFEFSDGEYKQTKLMGSIESWSANQSAQLAWMQTKC